MKTIYVTDNQRRRHKCTIEIDTGRAWWAGEDESQLTTDKSSYAYTHGGALYQAACDRYIELVV